MGLSKRSKIHRIDCSMGSLAACLARSDAGVILISIWIP
jgi:hypothetical protein